VTQVGQASPDGDPIRRIQEGDEAAARALFERYVPALRAQVRRSMPPAMRRKVAESDVIQEAYLAAFLSLGNFEDRGEEAFRRWLAGILQHKIHDEVRRFFGTEKRDARREQSVAEPSLPATPTGEDPSPSMQAMAAEERAAMWNAVDLLPADYARILQLVHRDGLTLTAAGERMGRSADAARKLYGRAVARLTDGLLGGGSGP
jgi:RNA polymerase sigma-70 factor (ECF subfamily)